MKRVFGVVLFGALSVLVVLTGVNQQATSSGDAPGQMAHPPSEAASSASAEASPAK